MSLRRFLGSRFRDLEMISLTVSSFLPWHRARIAILRRWGASISGSATLYHGYQIRRADRLRIGDRSIVGDHAILDARGGLRIGSDVNLSTAVNIWTAQHAWNDPEFAFESGEVVIGDRAWLSARVTVLPGVTIGEGAVVAAGAVVTRDLEPWGLYGGIPARRLHDRRTDIKYRLSSSRQKAWWW